MRGTVPAHRLMLHFVVNEIIWLIKTFIVNCLEVYQGYIVENANFIYRNF